MSRLVRLYPGAWRDRYEAEFLHLIEVRPPSIRDRFDILRGALDARLNPQVAPTTPDGTPSPLPDGDLRLARRLGLGTFAGIALWIAAWSLAATGPVRYDDAGAYRDGAAAGPFLVGAVALFVGGLMGQLVRLPTTARLARAGAVLAIPFTLLWGAAPWLLWAAVPMIGGLIALAVGARRSSAWPRWSTVFVALACGVVIAVGAIGLISGVDRMAGGALFLVAATAFVPAWLGVGATLVQPARAHV